MYIVLGLGVYVYCCVTYCASLFVELLFVFAFISSSTFCRVYMTLNFSQCVFFLPSPSNRGRNHAFLFPLADAGRTYNVK